LIELILNPVERFEYLIPAVVKVCLRDVLGRQRFTQLGHVVFELLNSVPKLTTEPTQNRTYDWDQCVE
jgi:hypothetical protein